MDNRILPVTNIANKQNMTAKGPEPTKSDHSFGDMLNNALKQVENDVKGAQELSEKLSTGEVKDLHQVMVAMEKANLGLQLTVQIRNKVVEAYQEIMRMQV